MPARKPSIKLFVKALTITPKKAEISIVPSREMFTAPDKVVIATPIDAKRIGVITLKIAKPKDGDNILLRSGFNLYLPFFCLSYSYFIFPLT